MKNTNKAQVTGQSEPPLALTIPQVCQMVGLSRSKLYSLIRAGDIASFKVGGCTRMLRSEVIAFVERMASKREAA